VLAPADRQRIRIELSQARRDALEAVAKARPEIERAMAQVRAGLADLHEAQEAVAKAGPEIERAMAQVRAELADQHIDVRIEENVNAALKRAEIDIQAAVADIKANKAPRKIKRDTKSPDQQDGK